MPEDHDDGYTGPAMLTVEWAHRHFVQDDPSLD